MADENDDPMVKYLEGLAHELTSNEWMIDMLQTMVSEARDAEDYEGIAFASEQLERTEQFHENTLLNLTRGEVEFEKAITGRWVLRYKGKVITSKPIQPAEKLPSDEDD